MQSIRCSAAAVRAALFVASPFVLSAAAAHAAPGDTQVVGNVRVEALSPTLVRLEVKGPAGFEDRATFHVVERKWPGATLTRQESGGVVTLSTGAWTVRVPANATSLDGVTITDAAGKILYAPPAKLTNAAWLPSPADKTAAWAVADTPRLAPPAWGATPAPASNTLNPETSGWDLANDAPDLYVFLPSGSGGYAQLRADYLRLTGRTEMLPLYLLGLFNSRYYPYKQDEALNVIATYRKKKIPLDVMVLDTDWRVGASVGYAEDKKLLPDLPGYLQKVHTLGIRTMFNDHPEPKVADALNPAEMAFRWDGLSQWLNRGMDTWWYDRNWGVSLKSPAPGLRHEVWGMQVYHDMTQKAVPGRRPAIMANVDGIDNGIRNRPPDMAAHRFPIQWTGDTHAQWVFLRRGVENAVYSGVHSLVPYMSEDLGGHNLGPPSPELYVRFLEYGALSPIMRPHCTAGETRAPWEFGAEAEKIVGDYTRMRYRLLPYLYAAARENYDTGAPIVRRLDLEFPTYYGATADDQYLLGGSLLVAPIVDGPDVHRVPSAWLTTSDGKPGLTGEYFATPEPSGTPKLTRTDPAIAFDWGGGSPDPSVPANSFSARWTGKIKNPLSNPAFLLVTADDGVRITLDGKRVVDEWHAADSVTYTAPVPLAPGNSHDLRVEYLEQAGNARIGLAFREERPGSVAGSAQRALWVPPGTWTNAFTGERIAGPRTVPAEVTLAQEPLFVRPGAIVPLVPQMQYTSERPWDRIALDVYPAAGAAGTGSLYEDDTLSNSYQTGDFRTTALADTTDLAAKTVRVTVGEARGRSFPGAPAVRHWSVRIHRPAGFPENWKPKSVLVSGQPVRGWRVLPKAPAGTMPFGTDGPAPDGEVLVIDLPDAAVSAARDVAVVYGE